MNDRMNQVNTKIKQLLEEGKTAVSSLTENKRKEPRDITSGGLSPNQKKNDTLTEKELEFNAYAPLRLFCPSCKKTFDIRKISSRQARCPRCLKRYQIPVDGIIRILRWEGKEKSVHSKDGIFTTGSTTTRLLTPDPAELYINQISFGTISLLQKIISVPVAYGSYMIRVVGNGESDAVTVNVKPGKYVQSFSLAEVITTEKKSVKGVFASTTSDKTKTLMLKKM